MSQKIEPMIKSDGSEFSPKALNMSDNFLILYLHDFNFESIHLLFRDKSKTYFDEVVNTRWQNFFHFACNKNTGQAQQLKLTFLQVVHGDQA